MAVYSQLSAGDISSIDDMQKVRDYLYKLNKNLKYMFNNLTPEDNYSEMARLTMVTDGERQATIEATLEGINLDYVSKNGVVSAINLSEELIQIDASKIKLEGMVTVNGNFKVGLDGSIEAKNGKFSGDISASTIRGSNIIASNFGNDTDEFYIMTTNSSRTVASMSGFTFEYNNFHSETSFDWENPASRNGGGEGIAMKRSTGAAGFYVLYVHGVANDIATEISNLWDAIHDIDDDDGGDGGGGDGGEGGTEPYDNGDDMPGNGDVDP